MATAPCCTCSNATVRSSAGTRRSLEEAPAPGLPDDLRAALGETAVRAARAVGYVGAGTVEFVLDADGFYFIEMNTRLQVEHPVTEAVTGIDLVAWQLDVAAGGRLALTQDQVRCQGHALEARLCAEDPVDFQPRTGQISYLRFPGDGTRVDTGGAPGRRRFGALRRHDRQAGGARSRQGDPRCPGSPAPWNRPGSRDWSPTSRSSPGWFATRPSPAATCTPGSSRNTPTPCCRHCRRSTTPPSPSRRRPSSAGGRTQHRWARQLQSIRAHRGIPVPGGG